ncbi:MAG: class II aldolase/adducin family protein [Candidatus Promineifilaceae bacterium]
MAASSTKTRWWATCPTATFNLNPRAASIDTPLHAYVPHAYVDHMHPDAIIAIAASTDSKALTQEIFGDEIGWLPWKKPGFELGLWLGKFCAEHPEAKGVVLESHGLFTWGDTPKDCYEQTIATINKAIAWFEQARPHGKPAFGGAAVTPLPTAERRAIAGAADAGDPRSASRQGRKQARPFRRLRRGAGVRIEPATCARWRRSAPPAPTISCAPRSGRWWSSSIRRAPMSTRWSPSSNRAIAAYRDDYAGLLRALPARRTRPAMRDANAGGLPGARRRHAHLRRATRRRRAFPASSTSTPSTSCAAPRPSRPIAACAEQEAFDIEYWLLEEAKLQRMPKPKSLAGHIALRHRRRRRHRPGHGDAAAGRRRLRRAGRHRRGRARRGHRANSARRFGKDFVAAGQARRHRARIRSIARLSPKRRWNSAASTSSSPTPGIASSAPIEETTLAHVEPQHGHPRQRATSSSAARRSGCCRRRRSAATSSSSPSKNGLAASPNASAYCTAKAAEIHLARCLALEGRRPADPRQHGEPGRGAARLARSGPANGASSAPRPTRSTSPTIWRSMYRQRSHAEALACSPRTSPRPSTSSPPTCRRNRPATSSMSTPATPRVLRADRRPIRTSVITGGEPDDRPDRSPSAFSTSTMRSG